MAANRLGPIAGCAIVIGVVAAAWVAFFLPGRTLADAAGSYLLTNSAMAVTFSLFGAVVLAHRPGHRIGLLFAVFGGCYTLSVACLGLLSSGLIRSAGWERAVDLVGITIWIPAVAVCLPLILQLFPNGRPLSKRWRPLTIVTIALLVLTPALSLAPGAIDGEPLADQSPVLPAAVGRVVGALVPVLLVSDAVVLVASLLVLGLRGYRAIGPERLQVMWLWWAVVVFVVLNVQRIIGGNGPILFLLTLPLIPAAATVAIVRYQLYDIRLIVNRTLVYGLLTIAGILAYLGIIAGLAALANDQLSAGQSLVATAVIAVAFAPARAGLQTAVDRLM